MAYTRKTRDEFALIANYGYGEEEESRYDTRAEARQGLKEYRENGGGSYYLKTVRVPIGK